MKLINSSVFFLKKELSRRHLNRVIKNKDSNGIH